MADGVALAGEVIDAGRAEEVLEALVRVSREEAAAEQEAAAGSAPA
jgi:hypothetical protein